MKKTDWRLVLVVLLLIGSAYILAPTIYGGMPKNVKKYFVFDPVKLGLDLQGGIHILLQVEAKKALESVQARKVVQIKEALAKKGLTFENVRLDGENILVSTPLKDKWPEIEKAIKDLYAKTDITKVREDDLVVVYSIGIDEAQKQQIETNAVKQAVETIRNRIDQFGVAEPIIHSQGIDQIVVELPGVKDPKRAIELIGKTARLEFKLVRDDVNAEMLSKGAVPSDVEMIPEKKVNRETGEVSQYMIPVKKEPLITGDLLTDAQVKIDSRFNQPYVWIKFDEMGGKIFEQVTAQNVGKRMAIVLDGSSYSSPVIKDRIGGGEAVIEGNFDSREASDLAIVLRAGSLPAPVKVIQNITVGPTLGQDSINKGLFSGLIAFVFVMIFMIAYYKGAGSIAIGVLVLNLVYLVAVVVLMRATLTLPGIAGIILMIGIGVDSNVLIFERIKEEFALGKTVRAAIDSGFNNAFWTIIDSHVTTLLTAAILFQFGTGPIKGFAVTLTVGIIINLFTVLIGTRMVYDFLVWNKKISRLSI